MKKTKAPRTPSFRHHKATRQGFVEIDGRRIYLGRHDLPESRQKYHQTIQEWIANGYRLPVAPEEVSVMELCAAYWNHAKIHYRKPDGSPTSEQANVRRAIRELKDLYGTTRVGKFGPLKLKAVRNRFIEAGLCRRTVNRHVDTIRRVFRWGVSEAMVPVEVLTALETVDGLRAGRSEAKETEAIRPVPESHVQAVKPHVSRQVWALIELQLLTGARGGELIKLKPMDFDTSGPVWTVTLDDHKTSYRGRERVIYFGPKAQAIVRTFMERGAITDYLFSPHEAEHERHAQCPTHRRPDQESSPRKTKRVVGEHYSPASYRRAIERACNEASVPTWTPHRLRHSAGTRFRKEYGLEAAQLLLGHARADVTQIYAEADHTKAIQVVKEIG